MAFIKSIIEKSKNLILKYKNGGTKNSQIFPYHKLTPVSNVDLGEYENALLFALSEKDVRNIAITGVYGSGKSSLIKSFEQKYKHDACFNFLNVSLASFVLEKNADFDNSDVATQNSKRNETQDIEKSLLQQIIFKVKCDELEDSQFSRIKIKRFCFGFLTTHFWTAFFLVTLVLSLQFVFKPTYFLFNESWLFKKEYTSSFEVIVLISVLGLIQLILNWIPKLGLSKLSAGGAEISFNEKKGDSILNKHLDELIYFFATTRFNVVIFEDLDRLPNREILIKLREINQLINNSEEINQCGKNKIVKFVFALGDDLFTDAIDRTKFFDFIIPVIPIVNFSNSRKKLEDAIQKAFPKIDIKEQFLDEVTQFLDDMRLLFNISNEFIIYKHRLDADSGQSKSKDKLKLDNTKLLALVIYKNKYPDDFGLLNKRQGFVWGVLSKKEKLIEHLMSVIKNEISDIRNKILEIEAQTIQSITELKLLYLAAYWRKHPDLSYFMVDSAQLSPEQLIQDNSLFDSLTKHSNLKYKNISNVTNYLEPFSSIEAEIDSSDTYANRFDLLEKKESGFIGRNKSRISELEKQLERVISLNFHELAKINPDFAFSGLGDEHSLIKYLIIEGLIGEDFLTYITYFYSGELSSNDQQFLISQLSNTPLVLDYKLDSPNKVFEKIKEERFRNLAILNIDLFNYVSLHKANTKKFDSFVETILESKEIGTHFLYDWFKKDLKDSPKIYVLNSLTKKDEFYWKNFFESFDLTNDEKKDLIIALLEYLDRDALNLIDKTDFFQFELNNIDGILNSLAIVGYDKLKSLFKSLRIVFSSLKACDDEQLLKVIEGTDSYEINEENLIKILSDDKKSEAEVIPTYSLIKQKGSDQLKRYVQRRLNWFIGNVLVQLNKAEESESSIIELLNSNNVEDEVKVDLIESVQFKIININAVEDKALWKNLLEYKKIDVSWDNVIKYFTTVENEIDDVLISFFDDLENDATLSGSYLKLQVPEQKLLARKIINCNDIAVESYKILIGVILIRYADLSDIEVSQDKLKILLDAGRFDLSVINHEFLKANLANNSYILLEQYFEEYLKDVSKYSVSNIEYIGLIDNSSLSVTQKLQLIKTIPQSSIDDGLAKAIFDFVLNKTEEKPFDSDFVKKGFDFNLNSTLKTKLLNRYVTNFDNETIKNLVVTISNELAKLSQSRHAVIPKNEDNLRLVNALESLGFISFKDYKKDQSLIELIPRKKIKSE